jgi:sulfite reductase beta subunit-like hemoprotein
MYRDDVFEPASIEARIADFGDQIERRLAGELTEAEFEPLRLRNGVHLQPHSYMLNVAVAHGTLNARQLRTLAHVARTYDRGYGHFTASGDIQFQWPRLSDLPAMLADLATVGLYARDLDETRTDGVAGENTTIRSPPDHVPVTITLKTVGGTSGDISDGQMEAVAELAERYGSGEIRITGDQALVLPHIARADLEVVHETLAEIGLEAADASLVPGFDPEQIVAVDAVIETYLSIRNDHSERFLDVYRRVGPAPFKEALHGTETRVA